MPVKSNVKILQNFVAFSEYMNFKSFLLYNTLRPQRSYFTNPNITYHNPLSILDFDQKSLLKFAKCKQKFSNLPTIHHCEESELVL